MNLAQWSELSKDRFWGVLTRPGNLTNQKVKNQTFLEHVVFTVFSLYSHALITLIAQSQLKEFQMQTKIHRTHQDYGIGKIKPTSPARTGRL